MPKTANSKLGVSADIITSLTLLAALPYELGEIAEIIPPKWKAAIAITGIAATVTLRLIKRWKEYRAALVDFGQPKK